MGRLSRVLRVGLFCVLVGAACSNEVVALSGCPTANGVGKRCEGPMGDLVCVALDDPSYDCARASCAPCVLPNAMPICGPDGTCAVGTCFSGFADCDSAAPGCETDKTSDLHNCGSCANDCDALFPSRQNTESIKCENSMCKVDQCNAGFADCNGSPADGCEQAFDAQHCGGCDPCPAGSSCDVITWTCQTP